jgi:hypothetical protein
MSKALYGHLGGPDAALLAEVTRLRRRVRELEEQVAAYEQVAYEQVAYEQVSVSLHEVALDEALRELGSSEPALA